jgi:iron(III) transport system substrate-binding protein
MNLAHKRNLTGRRLKTLGVVAALALAGCGGDDDDSDSAPGGAGSSASTVESAAETEAASTTSAAPATVDDSASDGTSSAVTAATAATAATSATSATSEADPAELGADVIAAAEAEGEVYVYGAMTPADAERLAAAFNEVYPNITVTFDRRPTPETNQVIEAEAATNTPIGDLYFTSGKEWLETHGELLTPISSPNLTVDEWVPFVGPEDKSIEFYFVPLGVGWNTGPVPDGIDDLDGLPAAVDGLTLGTIDPATALPSRAAYMHAVDTYGEEWLNELLANGVSIYDSGVTLAQALAAGEVDVAWPALSPVVADLQAQGAPVEAAWPPPQSTVRLLAGVLALAPHPNAAQLLVDFALSPAGQAALAVNKATPLPGVPDAIGVVSTDTPAAVVDGWSQEEQDAFMAQFDELAGR